jgi:hypothetical protein
MDENTTPQFVANALRPFPNVAWLELPLNTIFPAVYRIRRELLRAAQKAEGPHLIGAALLCMAAGLPVPVAPINAAIIRLFWFMFKVGTIVYIMIWFRGTFPRFRYDQLMHIGWKCDPDRHRRAGGQRDLGDDG